MDSAFAAFLQSWPFDPWLLLMLGLTAGIYSKGWLVYRRKAPQRWSCSRLAFFLAGLATIFIALGSPIEPFASLLLQMHMLQHLLLMMVAPALLWLGEPFLPVLRGLPRSIRTYWIVPVLRWRLGRRIFDTLTHPLCAWTLFAAATWLWHLPPTYELALRSDRWHYVQHACFLATGLLFWFPVIRPFPSRPRWSPWLLIPYLILADVQNTLLSALLVFSERPLYPFYTEQPRLGDLSPLDDQAAAGVLMWVPGSLAYLVPLFFIAVRLMFAAPKRQTQPAGDRLPVIARASGRASDRFALPIVEPPYTRARASSFDVLQIPIVGTFLRWKHSRPSLQVALALVAGLIVYDGLRGPSIAAMNLAGILPWIHWRGLLVVGMLIAGNVFCMACPFTLPRRLARRWLPSGAEWPHWLRNKWLAVLLLVAFLWSYETCAPWDSPATTAWLVLAYFAGAFVVEGFFQGGTFCKYVCPIGQFNFIQSLISPLEVKIRDPLVCVSCRTKECIRGSEDVPGCELHLYQPRKSGNVDCTFCLDCIHACPHQNVGILAVRPGQELYRDSIRSGIGRFRRRYDLAVMVVVLVFGAFTNAAGMTGPVVDWQNRLASAVPRIDSRVLTGACYLAALIAMPLAAVAAAALASRKWGGVKESWREVAARYSWALVPLGFSMWLTHYSFHFLTSYATIVPVLQRFVADMGSTFLGAPKWSCACCSPTAGWLLKLEVVSLDLGLLSSLYVAYRIATAQGRSLGPSLRSLAPWALLIGLLFALGIWIVFQPMQMRGTMPMAG